MTTEKSCGAVIFRMSSVGAKKKKNDEDAKTKQTKETKRTIERMQRKYLILHYEEGHWDFPKGHVEKGETEKETAKRETFEETGIKNLKFVPGFREKIEYGYLREGKLRQKEVVYFLAGIAAGSNKASNSKVYQTKMIRLSNEHIGYAWLGYEDARKKVTYENARHILDLAEKRLDNRF